MAVLEHLDIPYAAPVMNFIVLTAVLSCLNSGLYSSSRMIYSLARRGEAPKVFGRTLSNGCPAAGVLLASSVGLATVVANYFLPTTSVFEFLLDSSGSIAVVIYVAITVTHLRARVRIEREAPHLLTLRMRGFPHLNLLVLAALLTIIGGMAMHASTSRSLFLTLLVTAVAVLAGVVHQRRRVLGDEIPDAERSTAHTG